MLLSPTMQYAPPPSSCPPPGRPFELRMPVSDGVPHWKSPLTPVHFLLRAAATRPKKLALVHLEGGYQFTYEQWAARVLSLALALREVSGWQHGDRVAVISPNVPLIADAHYGVLAAGGIVTPLNYRNSQSEIAFILRHCGARVILVDHRHTDLVPADLAGALVVVSNDSGGMDPADAYEQFLARGHRLWMERSAHGPLDWQLVPPVRDEDATSSLCYTSGTTGRPKGVETSLRGSYLAALSNVLEAQLNGDSVYLWVLPMFHCSGWTFPWAVVAAMGTQRMLRAVDYGQIWDALDQGGVTHYAGAPTVQLSVVAHPKAHRLPQRVLVQVAASAPTPTLLKKMEALNLWPMHLYGLTETYGPSCRRLYEPQWSALPLHERAAMQARQGHAYAAADEVRVVRRDMPPGVLQDVRRDGQELGEIVMRGNLVMKRYFHDEDATAAATDGGYFHTGDLAVRHPGGEVQILDRGKDIIISGGENISSLMVEEMAASHPWVAECAVVARPHDRWGECVHAFVVLDAEGLAAVRDADANAAQTVLQSLAEHCRGRMSGFAIPRYLTIVDALPKSSTGKIQKKELRARVAKL